MPSRKGTEQALTWLRSKMAEKDTLDAINAEVCYNVIQDLKDKRQVIGALYHQTHMARKKAEEKIDQMEYERWFDKNLNRSRFTPVDIPDSEIREIFGNFEEEEDQ